MRITSVLVMALFLTVAGMPVAAEKERETWHYQTDGGIQYSNVNVDFYLYPEYECQVDAYQMPNYELAAAQVVATDTDTGEKITNEACWLEKDGVILVFDEHRRQFKHQQFQYEKIQ